LVVFPYIEGVTVLLLVQKRRVGQMRLEHPLQATARASSTNATHHHRRLPSAPLPPLRLILERNAYSKTAVNTPMAGTATNRATVSGTE
jgi:hypothetical protein